MPKFYCEYCDIYLTHDSIRARRDHKQGWKHVQNVKNYYMKRLGDLQETLEPVLKAYAALGQPIAPPPTTPATSATWNHAQPAALRAEALLASLPPPPHHVNRSK